MHRFTGVPHDDMDGCDAVSGAVTWLDIIRNDDFLDSVVVDHLVPQSENELLLLLPKPHVFGLLLPYLHSGLLIDISSIANELHSQYSRCNACEVVANALFLGLSEAAVACLMRAVLCPVGESLCRVRSFDPDTIPSGALDAFFRVGKEMAAEFCNPASSASGTPLKLILSWAQHGNWDAGQMTELNWLTDRHGKVEAIQEDSMKKLLKEYPNELVSAVVPAHALLVLLKAQLRIK